MLYFLAGSFVSITLASMFMTPRSTTYFKPTFDSTLHNNHYTSKILILSDNSHILSWRPNGFITNGKEEWYDKLTYEIGKFDTKKDSVNITFYIKKKWD
jgi:hypothetical protein